MTTVVFSSEQQKFTGEAQTTVSARNYRELLLELQQRYPQLDHEELGSMAIVIDGLIIHDPMLETLGENSEVHLIHFVAGG